VSSKLYDRSNNRIVVFDNAADHEFWDRHWKSLNLEHEIVSGGKNSLVIRFTKRFLPIGARILEGGCGIGRNVYGLQYNGFKACGIDFASDTVSQTKRMFPDLDITVQDVRNTGFPDDFFDGYWSLGVIEHFPEGHRDIFTEAARIIKNGGYFFLTFPYISPLRRFKIKRNHYREFDPGRDMESFYQYILDADSVRSSAEELGFCEIYRYPFDAVKGLKDEIPGLKPGLQKIYDSRMLIAKILKRLISALFSMASAHNILLVFRKVDNSV
jgi:SAM-dependent methyltransferase